MDIATALAISSRSTAASPAELLALAGRLSRQGATAKRPRPRRSGLPADREGGDVQAANLAALGRVRALVARTVEMLG